MGEVKTLVLNGEHIMTLTREPNLYKVCPFLEPMRVSSMQLHAKFGVKKCPACMAPAKAKAARAICGAFGNLVLNESQKKENNLASLHTLIDQLFKGPYDQVVIEYALGNAQRRIVF